MTRPAEPIFWTNHPTGAGGALVPTTPTRRMTLDSIGTKFASDKASGHHGFLGFYERFLGDIRDSALSVLEIGVNGGESLRMWEEYFPAARVLGIDHRPECAAHAGGRIAVAIAAPADVMAWSELGAKFGPFDLIVDDGTHLWEHQIAALRSFYPFVRAGGFYILEDIDTSYGSYVEIFRGQSRQSAANYLYALTDLMVGSVSVQKEADDDAFLKAAAPRTEFVAYHRRTALLRRRPA
jgi:SAM-dependent methyltransferase